MPNDRYRQNEKSIRIGVIMMEDKCVVCGKTIPEGRQVCVICGYEGNKKQRQIDRIKQKIVNMSVDEMAEYISRYEDALSGKICYQKTIAIGKPCPYGENDNEKHCIGCVKQWLESEVQGE